MTLWIADANPDYQKALDVGKLVQEGYSGLIIKATEGATWRSSSVADRWASQARNSGLIVGAYHWLTNANVSSQLDNFMRKIEAFGWPDNMIIALDVEIGTSGNPTWDSIKGWVDGWNDRTNGHPLLIYTGKWWWNAAGRRWNGAQLTPYLWHSQYVMQPGSSSLSMAGYGSTVYGNVPQSWWTPNYGGWPHATMLQFTSRGTAAGMVANIDLNAFEGTIGDLRALAGNAPQQVKVESDEMVLLYQLTDEAAAAYGESRNAVWASNGIFRWHVPNPDELNGIETMGKAGAFQMFADGQIQQCGVHIGHNISADARLAANTERVVTSWAMGLNPGGIKFSEDDQPRELSNPFLAIDVLLRQIMDRPIANITDEEIVVMAAAIAERMSTSVENVAEIGTALMAKLNAALSGVAAALATATQDPAPSSTSASWAPSVGNPTGRMSAGMPPRTAGSDSDTF